MFRTPMGFEAAISIPVDDDGYFGRECPECGRLFKMDAAKYEALPDDLELIMVYPLIGLTRSVASADMSGGRFVPSYWAGHRPHEQTA